MFGWFGCSSKSFYQSDDIIQLLFMGWDHKFWAPRDLVECYIQINWMLLPFLLVYPSIWLIDLFFQLFLILGVVLFSICYLLVLELTLSFYHLLFLLLFTKFPGLFFQFKLALIWLSFYCLICYGLDYINHSLLALWIFVSTEGKICVCADGLLCRLFMSFPVHLVLYEIWFKNS